MIHKSDAASDNKSVWLLRRIRQKYVRAFIPAAVGAVLLGGAGWLLGPLWAIAGSLAGPVAAYSILIIIVARRKPDPVSLLRAGRPREAYPQIADELRFTRRLAAKRPVFSDVLASKLMTMSQVLQALDNAPQALEAATEAAAIYAEWTAKSPGRYSRALARARLQQAVLLAHMGRHGEALDATEPAVQIYRRLAVDDRGTYLPCLAEALTRQADELGYLDRIIEARAAAAEAELIRTDMLLPAQP